MALDGFLIKALALELDETVKNARIDKIFMPRPLEVVLSLRTQSGVGRMMVSCSGVSPGVYMTSMRTENPSSPPMFCMLLRKHMQGGRILSVKKSESDRIIEISFSSLDELGDLSEKKLVCELMGKKTNILLLNEDGIILGCLKKFDFDERSGRAVLPGMLYRTPLRDGRPVIAGLGEDDIKKAVAKAQSPDELMESFSDLSPQAAKEAFFRGAEEGGRLLYDISEGNGRPYLIKKDGRESDISCFEQTWGDFECLPQESFSGMIDSFYGQRRGEDYKKGLTSELKKTLDNHKKRIERRLAKQRQELLAAEDRERLKKEADLITSNLYAIKSGDRYAEVTDYFSEGMPTIKIALDADISPQQNAQRLYKKYARLKNAEEALSAQIALGESELEYVESLLYSLSCAEGEKDIERLRQEAVDSGLIKKPSVKKAKRPQPQAFNPQRFETSGGFTLLRGRNNGENDRLSLKTAKGGDIWFHVKNAPGSHVILVTDGRKPSEKDIEEAAGLAAFYSSLSGGGKAAVDYTLAKHVKKPSGARPGMVNYFEYKTIIANPAIPGKKE